MGMGMGMIAQRGMILNAKGDQEFQEIADVAAQAVQEDDEMDLGDVPDEFLNPIVSTLVDNPVRLPTSGKRQCDTRFLL